MEHGIYQNSSQNFDSLSGSWKQSTTPQVNLFEALQILPGLGLKLSKTQSFLDKLDQVVQPQNSNVGEQANSNFGYFTAKAKPKDALQYTNKMKAENFPISLLRIGSWQRVLRNEGDLVAKCYFAKRKLVWEFLENGLKSKIEIQWSDILSLKAVMQENQPGILEIELNQPPSFHHEIDPQPRKHTQWRIVSDFTGGQALTVRRHYLEFFPGVLDKPLEKILKYDNRLFQLIRQGYPTLKSPFFQKNTFEPDFSFDFGGKGHINSKQQQFSFSNVPTYESPVSDEHISNQMSIWDQGNNVSNSLITNQVGGMSFATSSDPRVNSIICLQNNYMPGYIQEVMRPSTSQLHPTLFQETERHQLNNIQNMLFNNSQTDFSNGHFINNISNVTTNYGQNTIMSNNLSSSEGRLIYPQATNWSQSQVFDENMNMLYGNNLFYSSVNSDPIMQYYHEVNDGEWT